MNVRPRTSGWLVVAALLAVGTLAVPSQASAQAPDREFTIAIGETLTFDAANIEQVTIGMSKVADIQRSATGDQFILSGKSRGITTINIYTKNQQKTLLVRVVGVNPTWLAEQVRQVLGKGSGVDVRVVKGRVLLEGEVTSKVFQKKIKRMAELYPNQVLNFTTFRKAFVEEARMVAIDIHFVQMQVTKQDDLGVGWGQFIGANYSTGTGDVPLYYDKGELSGGVKPDSSSALVSRPAALTGGKGLPSYWSVIGNLSLTLDFLTERGMIKTINKGTLITEGGTKASYHSGGTLLIKLESIGGNKLERIPYGLNINVTPIVDYKDQVRLNIKVEMSELDFSNAVGDVPSLLDTDVEATVNMQEGQSVLISSQDNNKVTSNRNGWWMLSRIPIVGWLFKKRNYLNTVKDNAIFVTPRIYKGGSKQHKTLVQGIFKDLLDRGMEPKKLPDLSNAESRSEGDSGTSSSGESGSESAGSTGESSSKSSN
ncbi:MAG: pilus assembly protein N-terminal domain-containing protein [Bradymonadaceae bacterium]